MAAEPHAEPHLHVQAPLPEVRDPFPPPGVLVAVTGSLLAGVALLQLAVGIQAGENDGAYRVADALGDLARTYRPLAWLAFGSLGVAHLLLAPFVGLGARVRRMAIALHLVTAAGAFEAVRRGDGWSPLALAVLALCAFSVLYLARSTRAARHLDGELYDASLLGRGLRWLGDRGMGLRHVPAPWIALTLIAAGVALRVAAPFFMDLRMDGATYSAMGNAWKNHHAFYMEWGDVVEPVILEPTYSHHYPPAYPFFLGLVYTVFGFGLWETKLASLAVSLLALAVVWWCSRDLYGNRTALWATAVIAAEPHLVWSTGAGFSENLVVLFFALTMWAIVKSLTWAPAIAFAGLFAGLSYLSRASIGAFFLIAGVGGFLWRFLFMRWRVFTNAWYLAAIAIFGSIVAWWATRNVRLFGGWPDWNAPWTAAAGPAAVLSHAAASPATLVAVALVGLVGTAIFWIGRPGAGPGAATLEPRAYLLLCAAVVLCAAFGVAWAGLNIDAHGLPPWQTSRYSENASAHAFSHPEEFLTALGWKLPFFAVFFLMYAGFFAKPVKESLRRVREEHESALWLGVVLVFILSWVMTAVFWTYEDTSLFWLDNHRYAVIAFVPLAWLLLRRQDPDASRTKVRATALCLSLLAVSAYLFWTPVQYAEQEAAMELAARLEPGDQVAYDGGGNRYMVYPYMPYHEEDGIEMFRWQGTNRGEFARPDFIITLGWQDGEDYPATYEKVAERHVEYWHGGWGTSQLWEK